MPLCKLNPIVCGAIITSADKKGGLYNGGYYFYP